MLSEAKHLGSKETHAFLHAHANNGPGAITAALDDQPLIVNLPPDHRADGATFNHFGLLNVMKSAGTGGSIFITNLTLNGVPQPLDRDPDWDHLHNQGSYLTRNIRPHFDFGYSPTRYCGGSAPGEIGGLTFRGDCRYPDRTAYYADRITPLTLDHPIRASGKICLRRGVTDSTTLIGFFHAQDSTRQSPSQASTIPPDFLGLAVEGPSSEGFFVYPMYGLHKEAQGAGRPSITTPLPHIYPDSAVHIWSLDYTPDNTGRILLTFDAAKVNLDLAPRHKDVAAHFDHFGFITTRIDGNGQEIYLDDLTYQVRSPATP